MPIPTVAPRTRFARQALSRLLQLGKRGRHGKMNSRSKRFTHVSGAASCAAPLLPLAPFQEIHSRRTIVEEVFREETPHALGEVRLIIAKTVRLARQDEHVKAFIGLDQR